MSDDLRNDSGIEIKPLYSAADLDGWDPVAKLGAPGEQPYTRGVYPTMYRGKLWTMRQYAGFGTPESTNERFKFLLGAGQTGGGFQMTGDIFEVIWWNVNPADAVVTRAFDYLRAKWQTV